MAISLSTPVTGSAQTGLTTPTYTLTADLAPSQRAKQWAITALGGTQTGVTTHSVAAPFTVTFFLPANFKALGKAHPVTGVVANVPMNPYKVLTRKGVLPLAGQPYKTADISTVFNVPAGSDLADPANLRAALSLHIGALTQISAGLGDTSVTGIL